jgi:hypothetical protein
MARIYHPALDRYVEVPESAVPIHRESGWILADEVTVEAATPPKPVTSKPKAPAAAKDKE